MTPQIKRELRRRSAVEPVIGHLKAEHRMGRNYLPICAKLTLLSAPRPAPAKVAKTLEMFALSFQLISRWLDESPAACRGTLEALYLVDQNFATNGPPKR